MTALSMAERAEDDLLYADKQLVVRRTSAPDGLSIDGVVDAFNVDAFSRSLDSSLAGNGDLRIDLNLLEFSDLSGIRALVSAAQRINGGRRLILRGLPEELRTVMTVVGWTNLPGLVIAEARETDK
jgi:anti-anti-sigma regulatory factor